VLAVVTDLDGTIVREDGTVSEAMMEAARRLRERGVPLIAATARTPWGLGALPAGLFTLAVCSMGATGWSPAEERLLWREHHAPEVVAAVVEACRALPGAGLAAYDGTMWWLTREYNAHRGWVLGGPVEVVSLEQLCAVQALALAACGPRLTSAQIIAAMVEAGIGGAMATVTTNGREVVDIAPTGVDKRSGVARALARLGIPPHAAVAFGDQPGDVPMLELVGHGVVMGNAHPELLQGVWAVTESVEDDGVPRELARLGLIAR
jgi:hydroxymethylpyrimidine pyrophosphatase-like HAD family hydrolase